MNRVFFAYFFERLKIFVNFSLKEVLGPSSSLTSILRCSAVIYATVSVEKDF